MANSNIEKRKIGAGFGVLLVRDNKILLGKRHDDPEKADSAMHGEGTWTMPGGKLDFGERFEEGAARELLEETGIRTDEESLKIICVANSIAPAGDVHFVTIGLLCVESEGEAQTLEPDEITEWCWFSFDALPKPLFPPSKYILERYQKGEFYTK